MGSSSTAAQGLYTAAGVRELDRRAIEDHAIDGYALMERAGAAAFRLLCLRWPGARRVAVYCGGGNNGGDGLVVARLARAAGLSVRVVLTVEAERLKGAARRAWDDFVAAGGSAEAPQALDPAWADVAVDALLGTGIDRPVRGAIATAIQQLHEAGRPVLALDIPSGLQADTGAVMGAAVRAAATITFIGAKRGLYTGDAPDYTGPIFLNRLDVPASIYRGEDRPVRPIEGHWVARELPRLRPCAHKGERGRILVIGGDHGFPGAPRLAAEASLRAGAGLVAVVTRSDHVTAVTSARPELMVRSLEAPEQALGAHLGGIDSVIAGPGLGRGQWGREVLAALAEYRPQGLVLDADGLNLLAEGVAPDLRPAVITPHPGEAARLLASTVAAVQSDRFRALEQLVERYACTVVLKGPGTLVAGPDSDPALCPGARPGLAIGGSGDVLAGLIGALLGRGMEPGPAARAAVWLHAHAGRDAHWQVGSGALPGDFAALAARWLAESGANG